MKNLIETVGLSEGERFPRSSLALPRNTAQHEVLVPNYSKPSRTQDYRLNGLIGNAGAYFSRSAGLSASTEFSGENSQTHLKRLGALLRNPEKEGLYGENYSTKLIDALRAYVHEAEKEAITLYGRGKTDYLEKRLAQAKRILDHSYTENMPVRSHLNGQFDFTREFLYGLVKQKDENSLVLERREIISRFRDSVSSVLFYLNGEEGNESIKGPAVKQSKYLDGLFDKYGEDSRQVADKRDYSGLSPEQVLSAREFYFREAISHRIINDLNDRATKEMNALLATTTTDLREKINLKWESEMTYLTGRYNEVLKEKKFGPVDFGLSKKKIEIQGEPKPVRRMRFSERVASWWIDHFFRIRPSWKIRLNPLSYKLQKFKFS